MAVRGAACGLAAGASAWRLSAGAAAGVELLAMDVGLPRVAVPRVGADVAGEGFLGNCGRSTATLVPLISRRSGVPLWFTGSVTPSRIFMVGILARVALAIVLGSMP